MIVWVLSYHHEGSDPDISLWPSTGAAEAAAMALARDYRDDYNVRADMSDQEVLHNWSELTSGQESFEWSPYEVDDTEAPTNTPIPSDPRVADGRLVRYEDPDQSNFWNDDRLQFPRLLSEIHAAGMTLGKVEEIRKSMDLPMSQFWELFDRAHKKWEDIKERLLAGGGPLPLQEKLLLHVGHALACGTYEPQSLVNVAVECMDCHEIIVDADT